jgi:hypothetical protein
MWQRGDGIYGALAGLRLELLPIEDAPIDGPHWRLYVTQRVEGVDRDPASPTKITKPSPTGWAAVRERQSMAKQLAAIGMVAPHYSQDELQRDLGFDLEDDPRRPRISWTCSLGSTAQHARTRTCLRTVAGIASRFAPPAAP